MNYYQIIIKNQSGDNALPDYEAQIRARNKKEASIKFWEQLPETYCQETDDVYSAKDDWNPEDLFPFIRAVSNYKAKKAKKQEKTAVKNHKHFTLESKVKAIKFIALNWNSLSIREIGKETGYTKESIRRWVKLLRKNGIKLDPKRKIVKGTNKKALNIALQELKSIPKRVPIRII
jgi:transposase-like protein